MKKIFTLLSILTVGSASFSQVVFQSDLSSWAAGDPTDWMGSATSITGANVVEQTAVSNYGLSDASLINTTASHVRFTTQNVTVVPGETYQIEMWVAASQGSLRTGFYDATNSVYTTYNTYFDMAVESAGNQVLLTQQVTVPATCTSGQFILSLHSTDPATAGSPFFIGIIVDSVAVSATTPTPPTVTSIYNIQYTADISGDSPENGNVVTTYGIVTGVIGFGADIDRFFIQDGNGPWTGIYVYDNTHPVTLGDSVSVTGTVSEYFGLTELSSVTDVTIVNSGNAQPTPAAINTGDAAQEQYECVLVQVTDALCNNQDAGFGQFIVNDGSGDRLIDDQIYQHVATLNNVYEITGVTFLSFGEVKIFPRIPADINILAYAGIEENNDFTIYPNPANDLLVLNVLPTALVQIYSISGSLVYEANGKTTLDISALEPGIYMVNVLQNETVSTQKLVVE
ncbi:MAG: T9SS type A sorting domain-containing protein [Bacteroidetes bacterium]|nr:T9SS type A sorting domain-containing protein [Bacteroidota bacterium]